MREALPSSTFCSSDRDVGYSPNFVTVMNSRLSYPGATVTSPPSSAPTAQRLASNHPNSANARQQSLGQRAAARALAFRCRNCSTLQLP
jgi:hypothetical protein